VSTGRNELLDWIERDRDELVRFFPDFFRHRSPNPPGDTRSTAKFITTVLDQQRLPYRVISPHPEMPNIVGAFDFANAERHLVLNGHIDVFAVADDGAGWSKDPWGGEIVDGQNLRPRGRHEGRHDGLHLHLCIPASAEKTSSKGG